MTCDFTSFSTVFQSYQDDRRLIIKSGWSGGANVLGKLPVLGRPTIWITVGQGPTALAVGAGGGCLEIFTLIYHFFPLSPSLWETARYRLKYCLKGPLNPKQPTNQNDNKRLCAMELLQRLRRFGLQRGSNSVRLIYKNIKMSTTNII